MSNAARAAAMLLLVAVMARCPLPMENDAEVPAVPPGAVVEDSSLFVPGAGGSWSFRTNDPAYWSPSGFSLWSLPLPGQSSFTKRDVSLVKIQGNAYAGYGIVFCQHDSADPAQADSMLVAMINTQQQYSVGEVSGSEYTPYTSTPWVQDQRLSKGYGVANRLKITRDETGLFIMSVNDAVVMKFRDGRVPVQQGGGDGYLVVISPQDNFPLTPVSVSYTEN